MEKANTCIALALSLSHPDKPSLWCPLFGNPRIRFIPNTRVLGHSPALAPASCPAGFFPSTHFLSSWTSNFLGFCEPKKPWNDGERFPSPMNNGFPQFPSCANGCRPSTGICTIHTNGRRYMVCFFSFWLIHLHSYPTKCPKGTYPRPRDPRGSCFFSPPPTGHSPPRSHLQVCIQSPRPMKVG